jgi:hypothetical protein
MKRLLIPMIIVASLFLSIAGTSAQGGQCLFNGFPDETNTSCQYRAGIDIDFSYPLWLNDYPFALQPVQEFMQTTRDDFWNFAIASLDTMFNPWFLQVSYEEYSFSDGVRTIVFAVGGYSGGAHPYAYSQTFTVDYPTVRMLAADFVPFFSLERVRGIGVFVPPSAAEPVISDYPRVVRVLEAMDRVASMPLARLGDHVLLRFERTSVA